MRCCKVTDLRLAEEGFEFRNLTSKTNVLLERLRRNSVQAHSQIYIWREESRVLMKKYLNKSFSQEINHFLIKRDTHPTLKPHILLLFSLFLRNTQLPLVLKHQSTQVHLPSPFQWISFCQPQAQVSVLLTENTYCWRAKTRQRNWLFGPVSLLVWSLLPVCLPQDLSYPINVEENIKDWDDSGREEPVPAALDMDSDSEGILPPSLP